MQRACKARDIALEIMAGTRHREEMTQTGWAILGTGTVAHTFASALAQAKGARLISVMSREKDRASAFAAAFGGMNAVTELAGVLNDTSVDIVYIATPNHLHAEQAIACLSAGKAVLCEKPLATSAGEARRIAQAAADHGVFCMEALWTLCLPALERALGLIAQGRIGTVRSVTASLSFSKPYEPGSRFFNPALGGGALLDLGVYPLALTLRVLGPAQSVSAQIIPAPNGIDMQAALATRHAEALAQISCGFHAEGRNDMVICGDTGIITLQAPLTSPALVAVTATRQPAAPAPASDVPVAPRTTASRWPAMAQMLRPLRPGRSALYPAPYRGNGFIHQIEHAMACLRAGATQSERVPLSLSVAVLDVIDRARAPEAAGQE
jgi:predicted dehydrogenase